MLLVPNKPSLDNIVLSMPYLIFFIVLMLSLSLSITDVADEDTTNKGIPIITLIVNSAVLLSLFVLFFTKNNDWLAKSSKWLFLATWGMSIILCINDLCDKSKDNMSLPIIVTVCDILVLIVLVGSVIYQNIPN